MALDKLGSFRPAFTLNIQHMQVAESNDQNLWMSLGEGA